VLDPIEDLLKAEEDDRGLHFRLPCLNRHLKPLRAGDFGLIAARPDKGKTTFCASELTFMAAQVDELYPDENRSILWFNNEGPGRNIVMRNFQAALNATTEDLVKLSNTPADPGFEKYKTKVRQDYAAALGGRPGVLRVFDIHDMWNHEVEDIMKAHRPALVLFDMVDNIKFGGDTNNNGQRTDQLLEAMYQWVRMMGVKHDCAMLATSQLSADADGLSYPTLPMLKDSKTGKQGAADIIITIGALNDPVLENSRYIGTTKNKRVRTGKRGSPQQEVFFDSQRGRYKEAVG
jgi:replicative DNA helicase